MVNMKIWKPRKRFLKDNTSSKDRLAFSSMLISFSDKDFRSKVSLLYKDPLALSHTGMTTRPIGSKSSWPRICCKTCTWSCICSSLIVDGLAQFTIKRIGRRSTLYSFFSWRRPFKACSTVEVKENLATAPLNSSSTASKACSLLLRVCSTFAWYSNVSWHSNLLLYICVAAMSFFNFSLSSWNSIASNFPASISVFACPTSARSVQVTFFWLSSRRHFLKGWTGIWPKLNKIGAKRNAIKI